MTQIRPMTLTDVGIGMGLKHQAGWNQLESDWIRMLEIPGGGGYVAECDGLPVGTVLSLRFGIVAWIAMMLVDISYRGRGIGRELMRSALENLDQAGVESIRLDATPMGQPLYESLGFKVEVELARFAGTLPESSSVVQSDVVSAPDPIHEIIALDRAVTHTDRGPLLTQLAKEHKDSLRVVRNDGRVTGYLMSRPGAVATQVGPCIADEVAGPQLVEDLAHRFAGTSVYLDILKDHEQATRLATSLGLRPIRQLSRMGRGRPIVEDRTQLWLSAGPEKG